MNYAPFDPIPKSYRCRIGEHAKCPIKDERNVFCLCDCHPPREVRKQETKLEHCPNCGYPIER